MKITARAVNSVAQQLYKRRARSLAGRPTKQGCKAFSATVAPDQIWNGTEASKKQWSGGLSFANPEVDFTFPPIDHPHYRTFADWLEEKLIQSEWSGTLSFANPESDLSSTQIELQHLPVRNWKQEWSGQLSFSGAESDYTSSQMDLELQRGEDSDSNEAKKEDWSGVLSFASPESDLTSAQIDLEYLPEDNSKVEWSESLSFASPESDLTSVQVDLQYLPQERTNELHEDGLAHAMSYATPTSDFASRELGYPAIQERKQERLKMQAKTMELVREINSMLPKTFEEAMEASPQARVITKVDSPFEIVHVNGAWEHLCGFSCAESVGKSLAMIQGPETDQKAIANMMDHLLQGEEVGVILTNYKKGGQKFQNHLRVAPLREEGSNGKVTHFIGVLEDVGVGGH